MNSHATFEATAMHGTRRYLRALIIPRDSDQDHLGRAVGDDHILTDSGTSADGSHAYVTTDYVHTSELTSPVLEPVVDAADCARFLASAGNFWLGRSNDVTARVREAYFAYLVLIFIVRLHDRPEQLRRIPRSVEDAKEAFRNFFIPGWVLDGNVATETLITAVRAEYEARPAMDDLVLVSEERDLSRYTLDRTMVLLRNNGWNGSGADSAFAWLKARMAELAESNAALMVLRAKLAVLRERTDAKNPDNEDDEDWVPGIDDEGFKRCYSCNLEFDPDDPRQEGYHEPTNDHPYLFCRTCWTESKVDSGQPADVPADHSTTDVAAVPQPTPDEDSE